MSVGTSRAAAPPPNPIVTENQNAGTGAWAIPQPGFTLADDQGQQIKGYASAPSVNLGGSIDLFVTTNPAQNFTIDVYRLGWYGGSGGRLMTTVGPIAGTTQPACPADPATGLIACSWTSPTTLSIPTTWTTGLYLGVLTSATGKFQNYVTFTVRDDSSHSALLYQQAVTTYEAYNIWSSDGVSGRNFAGAQDPAGTAATKVSFDRPYAGNGSGYLLKSDINLVRWLERSGYDVAYSTDVDTHEAAGLPTNPLQNHMGFLSAGHDEFWSNAMFDVVRNARNAGVSLAFLGANSVAEKITFEASGGAVADRVIVAGPSFQDPSVNRPEQTLIGVQTGNVSNSGAPYVVRHAENWVYAGTGFKNGDTVPGLVSQLSDHFYPQNTPNPTDPGSNVPEAATYPGTGDFVHQLLSASPVTDWQGNTTDANGDPFTANSSIYQATSGAWVFAAGTTNWVFALDDFGGHAVDARIQRTTANILNQFAAVTTTALTTSPNPSTAGQNVTLTATVIPGTSTGTVTFKDGATTLGTGTLSSTPMGGAQATFQTSTLSAGSHSLTAVYNGAASSPVTQTVNKAATTTSLASSANPSTAGQDVTLTATVSPSTATGTVTFLDGATTLGTGSVNAGTATLTTSALSVGSHSLTASYGGDATKSASTSAAVAQVVNKLATTTTLSSGANPSTVGQGVTFTAAVSPGAATGTVTFKEGATTLGTGTLSGGTASFTTSSLTVGSHSITADYGGDGSDETSSSAAITQTVDKAPTTTSLSSGPNPSTAGQDVTLTATVSPSTATGTVTFLDGATTLGTGTLTGGTATFTTSALSAGSHDLTAAYGGDATNAASTSSTATQTVDKVSSPTSLTSSANPSTAGQAVTLTATVPSSATGTVTFFDGATSLGTSPVSGGQAALTTSALTVGSHNLTASYSGDATNAASTSAAITQTVNQVSTTTAVTSNANPSTAGQAVTLAATVSPSTATGTVTFFDGATSLGTSPVSGGTATFTTSGLAVGSHSVKAVYNGDATNATSTSATVTQTVNKVATTTAITSSLNPSTEGQTVTLTATVSPGAATGTVTFFDGATSIGTGTLGGGKASLATSSLSVGSHNVTAAYNGDAASASSTSGALAQTVNARAVVLPVTVRNGYWMVGSTGDVFAFGDAGNLGGAPMPAGTRATNMTATPSGNGYWVVNTAGNVFSFGDAPFLGGNPPLAGGESVTSISATRSGAGYWLFTSAGRVFPFGDAQFLGDMAGVRLNGPVLGSVVTPSGNGYYMVASDGGIFAFGDASFHGSMGNQHLNGPVVGLAPDPDGAGYWLVADDGGIFAFDAPFRGSMGSTKLNKPVIGMVAYGDGYLMVASDGGIFDFSSKPFVGSLGANPPANPIVAVTPIP